MRRSRVLRPAFALAVALAAIGVIGALAAGVLFASTEQYRATRASELHARALAAAEFGLVAVLRPGDWNPAWSAAPIGQAIIVTYSSDPAVTDTVRLTRLTAASFHVVSEAASPQSRRRVGALVTVDPSGAPAFARGRHWYETP
ncbi:MAG: hypothetical protein ABJD07_03935 [Gemmatimonadaceae bacterium]